MVIVYRTVQCIRPFITKGANDAAISIGIPGVQIPWRLGRLAADEICTVIDARLGLEFVANILSELNLSDNRYLILLQL